jgi:hypothetical protein
LLETVVATSVGNSTWVAKNYRLNTYLTPSSNMHLIVRTADASPGHLVEAGFDQFSIADSSLSAIAQQETTSGISVYPNPFDGTTTVHYTLNEVPAVGAYIEVKDLSGRMISTQVITAQTGTIELGQELAGGIYFVQMVNGTTVSPAVRLIKK